MISKLLVFNCCHWPATFYLQIAWQTIVRKTASKPRDKYGANGELFKFISIILTCIYSPQSPMLTYEQMNCRSLQPVGIPGFPSRLFLTETISGGSKNAGAINQLKAIMILSHLFEYTVTYLLE